ncbi:TRAP transporter large permease subunit [Geminicoccaceae bacterium 1502E]|nr:TRAP transporter large permease subunit [Geminicoccaceae bacterium 1502E]
MIGPGLVVAVLLLGILFTGLWVSLSLFSVSIVALSIFKSLPIERILSQNVWNTLTSPELLSLPLFILMAEVLFLTRISDQLMRGLTPWAAMLPGRLAHINVLACTIFATVSGSSAATTMTIGRITLVELGARGYDRSLIAGTLAGAGTLGFLIPPSIVMIIYAVLADVSLLRLFLAGIIPGFLIALGFMAFTGARAVMRPELLPAEARTYSWRERFAALLHLAPVTLLMLSVLGSMYGGIASPTEAAAMGVLGSLLIAALSGSFSIANVCAAFLRASRTTSMLGLIVVGASFLALGMGYLGIPRAVASAIGGLDLSPMALVATLVVFYLVLGMFLEGMASLVLTLPITLPLITQAGFDPIWFGVFVVITIEMAQITPPVGFNLFIIQSLTKQSIGRIARDALPFLLIMIVAAFVLALVPDLALWLPDVVMTALR